MTRMTSNFLKGTVLLLPFLIIGYQGCGKGFVVDSSEPPGGGPVGSLNAAQLNLNISDKLNGQDMVVANAQVLVAGVDYVLKPTVKSSGKTVLRVSSPKVSSIPAQTCQINLVGQETQIGKAVFSLFCNATSTATLSFTVEYEDGTKSTFGEDGNATFNSKSQKDLVAVGSPIYAAQCASCHQSLDKSAKKGRSADAIKESIGPKYTEGMNTPAMLALSASEIRALAAALATPSTDSQLPVVAITSPTADQVVKGQVQLTATATDNVGVTSVQFYVDGKTFGSPLTSSPYSANLDTVSAALVDGAHMVYIRASDAAGNFAQSASVTFQVKNSASQLDGAKLYADNGCATCHSALASSDVRAASRAALDSAITKNLGGMKTYSVLTDAERNAIIEALK